jgi:hypothetical protein
MLCTTVVDTVPSVLFLFVTSTKVDIDPRPTFTHVDSTSVQSVVYQGASHFTTTSTRIIAPAADVWFHDRITTRGTSICK